MTRLFADHALLPEGFASRVLLSWDDGGRLTGVQTGVECPADADRATGLVVPSGDRTVVVIGLEDVVVVDTPDAVLVTTRARAQQVKQVVAGLKEAHLDDLT